METIKVGKCNIITRHAKPARNATEEKKINSETAENNGIARYIILPNHTGPPLAQLLTGRQEHLPITNLDSVTVTT